MEEKPKLRYFDIIPYKNGFLIKDPLSISREMFFSKDAFLLLSLIDGESTIDEIKIKYLKNTGILLSDTEILSFISELDKNYLLHNERFLRRIEEEKKKIENLTYKEIIPYFDMDKLKNIFKESPEIPDAKNIKGIIMPHIDIKAGIEIYKKVFSYLKSIKKKIFFILGVPHFWNEKIFSIFSKNLKIENKIIEVDENLINKIKSKFDYEITDDYFAYKNEHSVEFPVLFISFLNEKKFVIPSLVGNSDKNVLKEIANKIFEGIKDKTEEIFIISSIDLSHVGRKFGDEGSFDTYEIDKTYINYLENLENDNAFDFLEKNNNFTKIDGKNTNFIFLELIKYMGSKKGKLVDYKRYYENITDSTVSFALIIYE